VSAEREDTLKGCEGEGAEIVCLLVFFVVLGEIDSAKKALLVLYIYDEFTMFRLSEKECLQKIMVLFPCHLGSKTLL